MDKSVSLTIARDRAYVSFSATAVTITGATGTFTVDVLNATAASPLQVPLACNFCVTPMTGETYMRLTRGRATATGPGSDVRIVARRTWGDDFAGCSTCSTTPDVIPSISLRASVSTLIPGSPTTITATISEPTSDFFLSDIQVQGGTVSTFAVDPANPLIYTFAFTASSIPGTATIIVPANKFSNSAGNYNVESNTLSITIVAQPTITLTSSSSVLTPGSSVLVTATLSEPTSDFDASDIQAQYGTLSNFTVGPSNPLIYTFTFTASSIPGTATIIVPANKFSNSAGVYNIASNTLTFTIQSLLGAVAVG